MRPIGVGNRSVDQGTKYYVLLFFFCLCAVSGGQASGLERGEEKKGKRRHRPVQCPWLVFIRWIFFPSSLSSSSLGAVALPSSSAAVLPSFLSFVFCVRCFRLLRIWVPPAVAILFDCCAAIGCCGRRSVFVVPAGAAAGAACSSRLRLLVVPPLRIAAGVLVLRVFLRRRADLLVLRLLAGFLLFRLPASVYLCVRLLALGMLSLLIFL